jgi:hypothetical protein
MTDVVPPAATPAPAALSAQFLDLFLGYQRTQLLYVAATLGLADLLADGPRTVADLATATSTHPPSFARVLRALAGLGVFAAREDGRYELTPLAQPLRSGVSGSLRALVLAQGEDLYPVWGALLYSVQTGAPAFDHLYGMANWEYRKLHPDVNARFNAYMSDLAGRRAAAVAAGYPFPDAGVVIDVGGGDGTLLAAILARHPGLRGILFDQPHVVKEARQRIAAAGAGITERVDVIGGDFFAAVPAGGDYYLLSAVLHDWGDDHAAAILAQCRRAMEPGAKLLVIEQVLPPGNDPSLVKLFDILMLVTNAGGRERTEEEWRTLLAGGGFALQTRRAATPTYEVLEAAPS